MRDEADAAHLARNQGAQRRRAAPDRPHRAGALQRCKPLLPRMYLHHKPPGYPPCSAHPAVGRCPLSVPQPSSAMGSKRSVGIFRQVVNTSRSDNRARLPFSAASRRADPAGRHAPGCGKIPGRRVTAGQAACRTLTGRPCAACPAIAPTCDAARADAPDPGRRLPGFGRLTAAPLPDFRRLVR